MSKDAVRVVAEMQKTAYNKTDLDMLHVLETAPLN